MNINQFKEGDVITRNEPCIYDHNGIKDGSYMGERYVFVGKDSVSKIIFLVSEDGLLKGEQTLDYGRDRWDEGWCYYPQSLLDKAKKMAGKLLEKQKE
jgi:hypothetical protein